MRISKKAFTKWASEAGRESWCLLRETSTEDNETIQVWLTPNGVLFQARFIKDELVYLSQGGGL